MQSKILVTGETIELNSLLIMRRLAYLVAIVHSVG